MSNVTLIIGLPGSGKTTLIEYYKNDPFKNYSIFDEWNIWTHNDRSIDEFDADVRLNELSIDITNGNDILIGCTAFCNFKFLHQSELYLISKFPNININRIYFENNVNKACNNIKYRDIERGGYWKDNEQGMPFYYGKILNGRPRYQIERENAIQLAKDYIIPIRYKPLIIKQQTIKNNE